MNRINNRSLIFLFVFVSCGLLCTCQSSTAEVLEQENPMNQNPITQFVSVSSDADLQGLPTSSTYIKEQSLKGQNSSPYGYIVRRPEGFGTDGKAYPILVFLHGAGSRGNSANNPTDLNKVDQGAAIRAIKLGLWNPKVSLPVFAPQSATSWKATDIRKFIQYLTETYPNAINTNRIYLSGFSMGGSGTWSYLNEFGYQNSQVAAAVSLAGAIDITNEKVESLKLMPFWMFHGQKDPTVPVSRTTSVANKFESKYPEQDHQKVTIFTQNDFSGQFHRIDHGVYDDSFWSKNQSGDLFDVKIMNWMLQYKRTN